jgi:hypothetical protein
MTEQRSPDEEPIIELTDVVEPSAAGDDEIIELTEVVEFQPATDEEVIELTDIVKTPPDKEEIIDLVDVVDTAAEAEPPPVDEPEAIETPLTEITSEDVLEAPVEEPAEAAFDLFSETAAGDRDDASAATALNDDDLDFAPMDLDIEENKEEDLFDSLGMKLEPELQSPTESDELDFNLSTQELSDAIDLLDAKLAEEPPSAVPAGAGKTAALPATLSEAELERALENVIRKMFAEKIDQLLNEAIEKNVTAEIEHLKRQLLKDSPED